MLISKRLFVSTCVLGGATLLLIGAGAIPAVLSIGSLEKKLAEEHANIELRYRTRQVVRESLSSLEGNKNSVASLKQTAIVEGEELAFISAIEAETDRSGVTAKIQLETANQRDLSSWEKDVPVNLTVTGKTADFLRFLDGLERSPYSIAIDNIDIRRNSSGTGPAEITAKISGSVYWIGVRAPKFVTSGIVETGAPAPQK